MSLTDVPENTEPKGYVYFVSYSATKASPYGNVSSFGNHAVASKERIDSMRFIHDIQAHLSERLKASVVVLHLTCLRPIYTDEEVQNLITYLELQRQGEERKY